MKNSVLRNLKSNHAISFLVLSLNGLWFQDCLPIITLTSVALFWESSIMTVSSWVACYFKIKYTSTYIKSSVLGDLNIDCSCSLFSSVTTVLHVISRPSPVYNSSDSNNFGSGDLNNDHSFCTLISSPSSFLNPPQLKLLNCSFGGLKFHSSFFSAW